MKTKVTIKKEDIPKKRRPVSNKPNVVHKDKSKYNRKKEKKVELEN